MGKGAASSFSSVEGAALSTDHFGNVLITGRFYGTVDFGLDFGATDIKISAAASHDIFVTKINSEGAYGWTRIMGGSRGDGGEAVALDAFGNAYITGYFSDSVNFGADFGVTDSKTSAGSSDIFLTKLDLASADLTIHRHAVGDFDWDHKDEVAVDFGTAGIWLYDQGNWTQLAPENPESLMAGNIGYGLEILADLGSQGPWRWRSGTWSLFSGADVESMAAGLVWIYGSDSHPAFVGDISADSASGSGAFRSTGGSWIARMPTI